ncbi:MULTISPECIES: type II secretion system F family protein [Actinomyces]|nr:MULTISPECIES: type II secretion system F family protein [Actinomyces]
MTLTARFILIILLVSLAIGVWAVVILADEFARRRELWSVTVGESGGGRRFLPRLERILFSREPFSRFSRALTTAGLKWSPLMTLLGVIVVMLVIFVASRALLGYTASIILTLITPAVLQRWLSRRSAKRLEDFIAQLPELTRIIANGNSAGLSMGRCLAMAGREMAEPAGAEMRRVVHRLEVGWSTDQALAELAQRMPSREINILMRTIIIQGRTGGALTDALFDIAQALEQRKELHREVQTVILGSAVSGYAVMLIGGGAVILLNFIEPGLIDQMAGSFMGQVVLVVSGVLFLLGAVLMKIVGKVDV